MIVATNRVVNGKVQYYYIVNGQLVTVGSLDEIKSYIESND